MTGALGLAFSCVRKVNLIGWVGMEGSFLDILIDHVDFYFFTFCFGLKCAFIYFAYVFILFFNF